MARVPYRGFAPGAIMVSVSGDGFTARKGLLAWAGFWAIGVVMLVFSLFGSVGLDRFRHAPVCASSQVFTSAYCRITVDATVTALTRENITLDLEGRQISPQVF